MNAPAPYFTTTVTRLSGWAWRTTRRRRRLDRSDRSRQVGIPTGVWRCPEAHEKPSVLARRLRRCRQFHARLLRSPVALAGVTGTAGRHDVLPGVGPVPRAGDHMIEVLGPIAAVLADRPVPGEDRSPIQGDPPAVRDPDVTNESNDCRDRDTHPLRAPMTPLALHQLCLVANEEHHCAAGGDHRERLVRSVQHQSRLHGRRLPVGLSSSGRRPLSVSP